MFCFQRFDGFLKESTCVYTKKVVKNGKLSFLHFTRMNTKKGRADTKSNLKQLQFCKKNNQVGNFFDQVDNWPNEKNMIQKSTYIKHKL